MYLILCKSISMNENVDRSTNSFNYSPKDKVILLDKCWDRRKNKHQERFHTPTTFNFEITPPPPSTSANTIDLTTIRVKYY